MWLRANAHAFTVCIFEILTNFCHWNSFLYLCILNCGVSCLFFRCLWTVIEFLSGLTKKTVGSDVYIFVFVLLDVYQTVGGVFTQLDHLRIS